MYLVFQDIHVSTDMCMYLQMKSVFEFMDGCLDKLSPSKARNLHGRGRHVFLHELETEACKTERSREISGV